MGVLNLFFFGMCDLTFTFAFTFCFGAVAMGVMIWNIGDPGDQLPWSLESWSKGTVMLYLSL